MAKKNALAKKESPDDGPFAGELKKAVSNLWYLSETDAEIVPIFIAGERSKTAIELLSENLDGVRGEAVEAGDLDRFFDRLTRVYEGSNKTAAETAERFAALRDLLTANLTELQVYRIGRIRIDIFVIGFDASGNLSGIRTRAVET